MNKKKKKRFNSNYIKTPLQILPIQNLHLDKIRSMKLYSRFISHPLRNAQREFSRKSELSSGRERERGKKGKNPITGRLALRASPFLLSDATPRLEEIAAEFSWTSNTVNGCRLVVVIPIVWELCVWLRPVGVVSIASCSIQQRTSHRYAWAYFLAIESFRLLFSDAPQHFYSSPRNFYHFNRDSTRSETTLDIIEIIFFSLPSPLLFLFLFFFFLV